MYRVKRKFAFTNVNVHKVLSLNSSANIKVLWCFYYIVEIKLSGIWKRKTTVNYIQENEAYKALKYFYQK